MEIFIRIEAHNRPGVLDMIAGLIRRKGWNIHSLIALPRDHEKTSLIFVALKGKAVDAAILEERLSELDGIISCDEMSIENEMIQAMANLRYLASITKE